MMTKVRNYIIIFMLLLVAASCSTNNYGKPNADFASIEKDFITWWNYHNRNIMLSADFVALDDTSNVISKKAFLELLASGNFIALKLDQEDAKAHYKLFKLDKNADPEISGVIKGAAQTNNEHFKLEGKKFPDFNFKDLDGKAYTLKELKNKTIVLKCWYIHCLQCVAEMPQLNDLVAQYENRNDIVFISLASDAPNDLRKFLAAKKFRYPVVPDQQPYFNDTLKLTAYPTHFIINKKGMISKVVNSAAELKLALAQETGN